MHELKYKRLFTPAKIGNVLFKNRIVSAPTGHPAVTPDNNFTEDVFQYYERKAQGGAGAIILGEAIVDSVYGKRHPRQISLDAVGKHYNLSRLTDLVKRHGTVISMELNHSGLKATPGIVTPMLCTASDIIYGPVDMEYNGTKVKEMPEEIILEIIEKFAAAAKRVKEYGFDMVTVHAAHGWLLNQFLTPRLNTRCDNWGGNVENRARFAVEVCDSIHKACGKGFPIEIRISATEANPEGYGIDEGVKMALQLEGHADIINVSVGCDLGLRNEARTFSKTFPTMFKKDGENVEYAAEISKYVTKSMISTVGALSDPSMMEEILATGQADFVELARGLICDPDLPNKARDGRDGEIVHCMRCHSCFSNLMTRGGFYCALNPETSRERAFSRKIPKEEPMKVLVAGGGIGGMQAALTAAENGHEVILCEKSGKLGGNIRCEEKVPFKAHLFEYIRQQERKIAKARIDLRLNTEVTPEYAESIGADVMIAALGAAPIKPNTPGIDGRNVLGADEAYCSPDKVGRTAVIIGAGLVGTELAIYLNSLGRSIRIVEMADSINYGNNFLHGSAITIELEQENIEIYLNTKALEIDEGGVTCESPDGSRYFKAETVIYAVGQKPLSEEAMAFYSCTSRFHVLGDCVTPQSIGEAVLTGKSIALDIGRF